MFTHDKTHEGFALFNEKGVKVALVRSHQQAPELWRGAKLNTETGQLEGGDTYEVEEDRRKVMTKRMVCNKAEMPRSSWRIHLTSPEISLADFEAILAALPDEAGKHPTQQVAV